MLRSFLRAGALGAVLTSGVACHLLLEGQDLGPGGTGAGSQGGAGGQAQTTATASTTSASSSVTTSPDGVGSTTTGQGGEGPCTTANEQNCAVSPGDSQAYYFDQPCEDSFWCYYDTATGTDLSVEDGALSITADPTGTPGSGWWSDMQKQFAPLMFKRVTGDFIIVARLTVGGQNMTMCPGTNTDFKVGGLLLRDGTGEPEPQTPQRFFKLEYGCLGGTSVAGAGWGALWAQNDSGSAAHLAVQDTPALTAGVGLAICRQGSTTEFFFRPDSNWLLMADSNPGVDPMVVATPAVSIGVLAGTYYGGGQATVAAFDYVGIRTTFETGSCTDEVLSLDDSLADGKR